MQPRETDGYLLMPARDDGRPGAAMRPFTGDCAARATNASVRFEDPRYEELARCGWNSINHRQRGIGVSTATIAENLSRNMLAPVSDRTGWAGLFTFDFMGYALDMPLYQRSTLIRADLPPTTLPQLLDAIRSELGLKLVKERTSVRGLRVVNCPLAFARPSR
jgi:uncharacterized protein (TIGR03435 family)